MYTTRDGDLVKGLQRTPWSKLAGRPVGRPRKTAPQATPVATPPVAKEAERPSEDADERRSAKAQDLNPPAVPNVIRVPSAAVTENEPSSSSSRPMETEDGSARGNTSRDDRAQVRSPAPSPSRPTEQAYQSGGHNVKSVNQPEQSACARTGTSR